MTVSVRNPQVGRGFISRKYPTKRPINFLFGCVKNSYFILNFKKARPWRSACRDASTMTWITSVRESISSSEGVLAYPLHNLLPEKIHHETLVEIINMVALLGRHCLLHAYKKQQCRHPATATRLLPCSMRSRNRRYHVYQGTWNVRDSSSIASSLGL